MLKRGAFRVLLAVALAGAGALFGAGLHWWVVQPTDAELIATAREVDLPGFAGADRPRVTGAWAPSFTRGIVHRDAVSTGTLGESAALASKALED